MELEELVKLSKNIYNHLHLKRKTNLTEDEYRLCQSLLTHNIDLKGLFRALYIINHDIQSFGTLRISRRNKDA